MPQCQDMLASYKKLDQRCLIYETIILVSYLLVLVLSWLAKKEGFALLGVLRILRLLLILSEVVIYCTGVYCRKRIRKLHRRMDYAYHYYGLEKL